MSSLHIRAEAAAWIARLHGPDRTASDERSFRRWLAASVEHAQAFEHMTEIWNAGARLQSSALARVKLEPLSRSRHVLSRGPVAVAASALLAVVFAFFYFKHEGSVSTRIGEQRTLTLEDGTRVTLNTATRMKVRYDAQQRQIELASGEALFEVARRANRPFIVIAGDRRIVALGTSFVVRRDPRRLSVTLMEGRVSVSSATPSSQPIELTPGQRLTFITQRPPELDEPALDKVAAWRQGVIALDKTPLAVAIAEMNRYSEMPLELEELDGQALQVSGVFKAGDSLEFARALARTHGLGVEEESQRIVLSSGY